MKWGAPEYKRVRITSIRCDVADIRRRMKEPHVKELAADIAARGDAPIHAPTVRVETGDVLCGRDRLAALMVNKAKTVWVHRAECTDQEAKALELAENIYRRADNRSELLAELQRITEQRIEAEQTEARARGEAVPAGPQNSPKALSRKEVARAAGVKPAAVRQAEQRTAQGVTVSQAAGAASQDSASPAGTLPGGSKHAPAVAEEPAPIALPPGFNAFDLEVPYELRSRIDSTAKWLGDWAADITSMLGDRTEMEKHGPLYVVAGPHLQKIKEALQAAGHAIRDAVPASLCWYCKAQPAVTPTCHPCGQTGVVGRHGGDNVPPEAKLTGAKARVAVNGKWVLVGGATNAAGAAATKPAKGARPIRCVVDGQEVELPRAEDEPQTPPPGGACICTHDYSLHDSANAGGGACSKCTCEMFETPDDGELAF